MYCRNKDRGVQQAYLKSLYQDQHNTDFYNLYKDQNRYYQPGEQQNMYQ